MKNKLKLLKQENLTSKTISALKEFIISESLTEGFKLPPERILSDQLGISRNIIREALKSLEANGIIKKLHGKGAFITPFNSELIAKNIIFGLKLSKENFMEFLDFHEIFEKFIINLTLDKLNKDQLGELESIIEEMSSPDINLLAMIKLEYKFFKKIIASSKNIVIKRIGLLIVDFFLLFNLEALEKYASLSPEKKNDLINQYQEILNSLKEKDPDRASKAIRFRYDYAKNKFYDFN